MIAPVLPAMISKAVAESTVVRIINGSMHRELLSLQRKQQRQDGTLASLKLRIEKMAAGDQKSQAWSQWQEARKINRAKYAKLREAIGDYNKLARIVQTTSLNTIKPKQLSALGIPQAVVVAGVMVAAGVLLFGFSAAVASIKNWNREEDGLATNIRKSVEAVPKAFEGAAELTYEMTTFVALMVGGFFAYQIWDKYSEGSRGGGPSYSSYTPSYSRPSYRPSSLARVEGEVA